MKNIINNFKEQIRTNGISQGDVKLLEDTIGEKVISSTVNIKNFTTERSDIALTLASEVLEHYVPETTSDKKVYTKEMQFHIFNNFIVSLQELTKSIAELTTSYNEDKKNTLFNLKSRWGWINYSTGVDEVEVWDAFSKKYNMTDILRNRSMIKEACGDKEEQISFMIEEFLFRLEKSNEHTDIKWEIGSYDTFMPMGLIINEEYYSYLYEMVFTPTKLSGEDLINFLDNSYKHYEHIKDITRSQKNYYISLISKNGKDATAYTHSSESVYERMEFLIDKNKITVDFLNILKAIFNSMSNL